MSELTIEKLEEVRRAMEQHGMSIEECTKQLNLQKEEWIHRFITESSTIDEQYDERGRLLPCTPGEKMYKNHRNAALLIEKFYRYVGSRQTIEQFIKLVHKELTKGLAVYGDFTGKYRKNNVIIRLTGERMSEWEDLDELMKNLTKWISDSLTLLKSNPEGYTEELAEGFAWKVHDTFECIHPFIDGNGRTGRILFNAILFYLIPKLRIIHREDIGEYFNRIREFREKQFPEFDKTGTYS